MVQPDRVLDDRHRETVAVRLGIGHVGSAYPSPIKATQPQEDLRSELFIMDGAFYAPFFGFGRTGSREVRTEISVVDALCGDHREDEIDNALEGINTEQGDAGLPGR